MTVVCEGMHDIPWGLLLLFPALWFTARGPAEGTGSWGKPRAPCPAVLTLLPSVTFVTTFFLREPKRFSDRTKNNSSLLVAGEHHGSGVQNCLFPCTLLQKTKLFTQDIRSQALSDAGHNRCSSFISMMASVVKAHINLQRLPAEMTGARSPGSACHTHTGQPSSSLGMTELLCSSCSSASFAQGLRRNGRLKCFSPCANGLRDSEERFGNKPLHIALVLQLSRRLSNSSQSELLPSRFRARSLALGTQQAGGISQAEPAALSELHWQRKKGSGPVRCFGRGKNH